MPCTQVTYKSVAELGFEPRSQELMVLTTTENVIFSEMKEIRLLGGKTCLYHALKYSTFFL